MGEVLSSKLDERGVATVTMERPEVHNAFNEALIAALAEAFTSLGRAPGVRAVVLRGQGASFSAGADLDWMRRAARQGEAENRADAERLSAMLAAIHCCPRPTIAVVHGAAYGGGVGLAAACDLALAGPRARFCLSEVRLGLLPAVISPYVVAAVGERMARRLMLTAEVVDAGRAAAIGLVHEQATDEAALEAGLEAVLADLLKGAPAAQAASKELVAAVAGRPIDAALRTDTARRIAAQRASETGREGVAAFLEKRPPRWPAS